MSSNWRYEDNRRADREKATRLGALPINYCRHCEGTGKVRGRTPMDGAMFIQVRCPACGGKGF